MSEDIKLDVLKTTQAALSKFIKKPPLTEKLLRKPPFRFLHDIVTSVMKETGFLEGLFTPEEMNPENIKDKDSKILFLEKLIAAVKIASGVNITARPSKIVAGLDVTKTNELLQAIAKALEKKVDSTKAVEQVLNKGKRKLSSENNVKQIKDTKNKTSKEIINKEEKVRVSPSKESINKTLKKQETLSKESSKELKKQESLSKESSKELKKQESLSKESSKELKKQDSSSKENVIKEEKKRRVKSESTNRKKQTTAEENVKSEPDVKRVKQKKENITIEEKHEFEEVITQEEVENFKSELAPPLTKHHSLEGKENTNQDARQEINEFQPTGDNKDTTTANNARVVEDTIEKTDSEMKRPQSARPGHRKKSSRKKIEQEQEVLSKELPKGEADNQAVQVKPVEQTINSSNEKSQVLGGVVNQQNIEKEIPVPKQRPRTATARPASARPGAPRVRDRGDILITEEVRAPGPVNVIIDTDDAAKEEEDENLIVVETATENISNEVFENSHEEGEVQGHLVAQILETQKELEDTSLPSSELPLKVEIDWKGGRQREHEAVVNEVDKLRNSIQAITRAANPLGKLIDFLQEDVDSMQAELDSWKTSNSHLTIQLDAEKRLTDKSIEPLQHQLNDVELLIQEQLEEINVAKATILRNDERIHKIITG